MAKTEKATAATRLTLVQIRYMEKRINATRDAAEGAIHRQFCAEQDKLPTVKERSKAEIIKEVLFRHPTMSESGLESLFNSYGYVRHETFLYDVLGLSKDWVANKEEQGKVKALYDALVARERKAFTKIKDIATEATDAIYLGDASQLNAILSKMEGVKL